LLKESGRSGAVSVTRQYFRSVLVTAQIALALVLLIGAGLMINSSSASKSALKLLNPIPFFQATAKLGTFLNSNN
jgi:hypothetical protein